MEAHSLTCYETLVTSHTFLVSIIIYPTDDVKEFVYETA